MRKGGSRSSAPVYRWFTEGFDTLDLKEAKVSPRRVGIVKVVSPDYAHQANEIFDQRNKTNRVVAKLR